ncbi:MAG: acyltransferase [Spirochaetia bacterium]|nr:acyltransferase [Spirochaetia bacterium]
MLQRGFFGRRLGFLWTVRSGEIPGLNGLRTLAILLILLTHFWTIARLLPDHPEWVDAVIRNFVSGVDLFFVLSGFLIYGILLHEFGTKGRVDLPKFYVRRTLRIFPGYYFFLLITLAAVALIAAKAKAGTPQAVAAATTLHGFFADFLFLSDYLPSSNGTTWSLAVEEQFYLVLPLLSWALLFRLRPLQRISLLGGAYLAVTFARLWMYSGGVQTFEDFEGRLYTPAHLRADALLAGVILAELYVSFSLGRRVSFDPGQVQRRIITAGTALVLLLCGHLFTFEDSPLYYSVFRFNALNLGFAALVLLVLDARSPLGRFFSARIWTPFAKLSYGVYLWHSLIGIAGLGLVIGTSGDEITWSKAAEAFVVDLALILLCCFLVFSLVEYPFLAWKDRQKAASPALAPAAAPAPNVGAVESTGWGGQRPSEYYLAAFSSSMRNWVARIRS